MTRRGSDIIINLRQKWIGYQLLADAFLALTGHAVREEEHDADEHPTEDEQPQIGVARGEDAL